MASERGLRQECPHPQEGDLSGLSGTEAASSQHTRVTRCTQGSHTQSEWTFIRESACECAEQGCAVGPTHFLRRRVTVSAVGGTGSVSSMTWPSRSGTQTRPGEHTKHTHLRCAPAERGHRDPPPPSALGRRDPRGHRKPKASSSTGPREECPELPTFPRHKTLFKKFHH